MLGHLAMMEFERFVWYFFIYSILGYFCEVVYCSFPARRFVNRGFLYGPYVPVYGFGAIAMVVFSETITRNPLAVFLSAMVVTSLIEYFTGTLLEKLFGVKLWDYSHRRCNIAGRVCMLNSTLFGVLAVLVVFFIHPWCATMMEAIPERLRSVGASVMLLVMAIDTTASIFSMASFTDRLGRVARLKTMLDARLELLAQGRHRLVETLDSEMDKLTEQLRRSGKRILDAFPGIFSHELEIQLQSVKQNIEQWRNKRKEKRK